MTLQQWAALKWCNSLWKACPKESLVGFSMCNVFPPSLRSSIFGEFWAVMLEHTMHFPPFSQREDQFKQIEMTHCLNLFYETVAKDPQFSPSLQMSHMQKRNPSRKELSAIVLPFQSHPTNLHRPSYSAFYRTNKNEEEDRTAAPTMCFNCMAATSGCSCGFFHTTWASLVDPFPCQPKRPPPIKPTTLPLPDHNNPRIYNPTSRFGNPAPAKLTILPREVGLMIHPYLLDRVRVYSNAVQNVRSLQVIDGWHFKNRKKVAVPRKLSILLTSRQINVEATFSLYSESGIVFRLHVGAVGYTSNQYSMPLGTQRTISLVQNLEMVIKLREYADLLSTTKEKWIKHFENLSSGSRKSCRIILKCPCAYADPKRIFASYDRCSLVFPKGMMRLLKLTRSFKTVEIVLMPDIQPRSDGSLHRFSLEEIPWFCNAKFVEDLNRLGLERDLGVGRWVEEKVKDRLVFNPP